MRTIYACASVVLALAMTITACDSTSPLELRDATQSSSLLTQSLAKYDFVDVATHLKIGVFTVCKSAPDDTNQEFTFTTTSTGDPVIVSPAVLKDGECEDVAVSDGPEDWIKIVETVEPGWSPNPTVQVWNIDEDGNITPMDHLPGNEIEGGIEDDKAGCLVIFGNEKLEIPSLEGRITGGGSVFDGNDQNNQRVTHGFELHCSANISPNNLEINWGGNRFHLEELTSAVCTDNPEISERPPTAGFDTYDGVGVGRYNGVSGFDIVFQLVDTGQPGTGDVARFHITDLDGHTVLSVGGNLIRGNHQTHRQTGR